MNTEAKLQHILSKIINIPAKSISASMLLIGEYAELDSMGVMTVLMEIERNFDFDINDMDLSTETFETLASLQYSVENAFKSSV
jgi:acyl carrier protein